MSSPLWAERRFTSTCVVEGCGAAIKKGCRLCLKHKKPKRVTQGRPSTKGSNARGIAAHKPNKSRTRKAKRQNVPSEGPKPLTAYRFNPAKSDRKPNEEVW